MMDDDHLQDTQRETVPEKIETVEDVSSDAQDFNPRLIATKEQTDILPEDTSPIQKSDLRRCQLSPDGTSLLLVSASGSKTSSLLETIILPPDLLTESTKQLATYSSITLPEQVRTTATYPFFDLSQPSSLLQLVSLPDHPLRLVNSLALDSGIVATYPYIIPTTEAYLCPHSLLFTPDGTHFFAGVDSQLAIFDVSRQKADPVRVSKLRPNGYLGKQYEWRMRRGIVSTMDISQHNLLAIGTFGREIGLVESGGWGQCSTVIDLKDGAEGSGVSKVKWSTCGSYLLVGERQSDAIQVFDVRGKHELLQTFVGRHAMSMMPLGWDLTPNGEVWAGGMDGHVRIWEGIGKSEGDVVASASWKAHEDVTIATEVHSSGSVIITGSAEDRNRKRGNSGHEDDDISDNDSQSSQATDDELDASIKVWSL
ncbi:hypothetical protein BT63DRAFT_415548 [Microthyrium microscopicum]|uniref:WD40 repeat-like protein n=1 Tax=Microthyrium microscopicum TaxID=703497 RepID=A0A6A6U8V0_9PEZI|nr:hypothetical protein BT63DRAFT_415548 [Microthyrium microscopicum]